MILVVADDFTGAAELAGIAWQHGLSSEVQTQFHPRRSVDVLSLDTDSRTLSAAEAERRLAEMGCRISASGIDTIYKKVDSLLRGPLIAETQALLRVLHLSRAILVPANPSLGRSIRKGRYYVEARPIGESELALEPSRKLQSSTVRDMLLASGEAKVEVLPWNAELPRSGIVIGEAQSEEDLQQWCRRLDASTLPGGAADFFAAWLGELVERNGRSVRCRVGSPDRASRHLSPVLIVSGSAAVRALTTLQKLEQGGVSVFRLPEPLFAMPAGVMTDVAAHWVEVVVKALHRDGLAAIAIGRYLREGVVAPPVLCRRLVEAVLEILRRVPVYSLLVEGGETASRLVRLLGCERLPVQMVWAPGVVTLAVKAMHDLKLTVKPGSYEWPAQLLTELIG